MSRFDLLHDAKNALDRAVDMEDLVASLFKDHPDLISFEVSVTNEYDDNNYSDYSRVTTVNGHSIDYEGEHEEEYDEEDASDLPKASQEAIERVMLLPEYVQEKWGHGEHTFDRAKYENVRGKMTDHSDALCAIALLEGDKVPVDTLLKSMERWVLHHADIHGRYRDEDEYLLFAREDMMGMALVYAERHGPLSDKTLNYFILSLKSEDHGYEHLQEYLEWLKGKAA